MGETEDRAGTSGLVRPLPGKIRRCLEDNLNPNEKVEVSLNPAMGEGIVVTESRVIFIKAGLTTGSGVLGARAKSFPFTQISSVDLRVSFAGGHLQVSAPGTSEVKDRSLMDMPKAENAVTFTVNYKGIMKEVAEIIRAKASAAQSLKGLASSPRDLASQLAEIARLKEQGILTDEEFAQAKSKLLAER